MKVRLTKKLAEMIDGIDLSGRHVGDVMNLPKSEAQLIIAEQWAEPVGGNTRCSAAGERLVTARLRRAS